MRALAMNDKALTIDQFCDVEEISRSFFYKLESQGLAPKTYKLGRTRRISPSARAAWRAEREAASQAVPA
jgi:predicted DNA-binding transcriptional regulator AlpA